MARNLLEKKREIQVRIVAILVLACFCMQCSMGRKYAGPFLLARIATTSGLCAFQLLHGFFCVVYFITVFDHVLRFVQRVGLPSFLLVCQANPQITAHLLYQLNLPKGARIWISPAFTNKYFGVTDTTKQPTTLQKL